MLPAAVYDAMDSANHLDITARAKFQKAIDSGRLENRLDLGTAAPFGYQVSLVHTRRSPWNAALRGQALALAGRFAFTGPNGDPDSDDTLEEETSRAPALLRFQRLWNAMLPTWNSPHEISVSEVGDLWSAVSWHMRRRALNAVNWNCQEVLVGCRRQCEELKTYPTSVTSAITQATNSLTDPAERRRAHNREVLTLFLPFWYDFIMERNRQDSAMAAVEVDRIMGAQPAAFVTAPPSWLPPPPYPPVLPPTSFQLPSHSPTTHGSAPSSAAGATLASSSYLGIPGSKLIVGTNIGFDPRPGQNLCYCAVSSRFTGVFHRGFECPLRYHARFGACPGWAPDGSRIATAWIGNDLTPATRAEWKAFIARHGLTQPRALGHDRVVF